MKALKLEVIFDAITLDLPEHEGVDRIAAHDGIKQQTYLTAAPDELPLNCRQKIVA